MTQPEAKNTLVPLIFTLPPFKNQIPTPADKLNINFFLP
jgi:hypothetical protein